MSAFNVFGPQDPDGPYAAAVPIFFQKALAGESLTIFGDGGATRDFIFVKDIVAALAFSQKTSRSVESLMLGTDVRPPYSNWQNLFLS